jgi:hypothetical protein
MHTKFWSENVKVKGHSEDLNVNGRILLEGTLRQNVGRVRIGCKGTGQGPVAGCCEQGNEIISF